MIMLGEITGNTKLWELGQRWETIEEAVSQQGKERSEDLSFLKEKLRQKAKMCYSIEIAKNEIIQASLQGSKRELEECQLCFNDITNTEDNFQNEHFLQMTTFGENYKANSKQFNSSIAAFTENILNQIATKMYKANENTCKQTLLTSDNCKENHIETIKAEMTSKKQQTKQLLTEIQDQVNTGVSTIREMLRKYHQKKEESNTKIKCLMNKLNEELNTVLMQETKLGDITYDSLLKLIEEAFARMQEMQLK